MFGTVFDDLPGLLQRDAVGVGQILVQTDFPHQDSPYPHAGRAIAELMAAAHMDPTETRRVVSDNAIEVFGLDRYFGIVD
jgi:hypothetical protein